MMLLFLRNITPRGWLALTVVVLGLFVLGQCVANGFVRSGAQKRDIAVARTTGKALDRVAAQTPLIRQEQKAKENEVAEIEGSDTRLPDGYGAALERVRRERH